MTHLLKLCGQVFSGQTDMIACLPLPSFYYNTPFALFNHHITIGFCLSTEPVPILALQPPVSNPPGTFLSCPLNFQRISTIIQDSFF